MGNSKTFTTTFGRNVSSLISTLGIRYKIAADQIGISYNTLSNIMNNKFAPSEETVKKIEDFIKRNGMAISLLYSEEKIICNFRLRIDSELSGNEKSALRNTLIKIGRLLNQISEWEIKFPPKLVFDEYFDEYSLPSEDNNCLYPAMRCYKFLDIIKKNDFKSKSPNEVAEYFTKPVDKELWGNLYFGIFTGSMNAFHIVYLVESLGIRIHFLPFGTLKAKSCSTSLFENINSPLDATWAKPSIFINTDVCDCAEKCLSALAEEFFIMITSYDEYDLLDTNSFKTESIRKKKDKAIFATELFLPKEKLLSIAKETKHLLQAHEITQLKNQLLVGYELLIKRLTELKRCTVTAQEYVDWLAARYKDSEAKVPYLHSEPEPLPISSRGTDFFDCAFLAACEKGMLSSAETADFLDCTEDELEAKRKINEWGIKAILENE